MPINPLGSLRATFDAKGASLNAAPFGAMLLALIEDCIV
jgi:hypothetical protein